MDTNDTQATEPQAPTADERRIPQNVTFRAGGETIARETVRVTDAYYWGAQQLSTGRRLARTAQDTEEAEIGAELQSQAQDHLRDEARALLRHAARLAPGARKAAFLRIAMKGR